MKGAILLQSFLSWIGGKNLLKKEIVSRFPITDWQYYVEVFGGAGWVLFHKEKRSNETEVYNDLNGELVNLFRCVKYHCGELQRELQFILNSREVFEGYLNLNEQFQTDIQRAARFFMLVKFSYAAKSKNYGCTKINTNNMVAYLKDIEARLSCVCIENKDFEVLIKSFETKRTLFFLDPPYYGTEKFYSAKFKKDDHIRLFESIRNIQNKFILTYNDCDFIRCLYADYRIEPITRHNNLTAKCDSSQKYKELIIRNY